MACTSSPVVHWSLVIVALVISSPFSRCVYDGLMHRHALAISLIVPISVMGCRTTDKPGEPVAPPMPYEPLRAAYNARTSRVEQMWARAVVELRWTDPQNKKHFEQGDGPLIIRKPGRMALAVGKLGNTIKWLGSDGQRYWLLDLEPPAGQPRTAHIGRLDRFDPASQRAPLPIRPDHLLLLMGLDDLPPLPDGGVYAADEDARPVVMLPISASPTRMLKLTLDRDLVRPVRSAIVEKLGEDDWRTLVEATLDNYEPLPLHHKPPGAWPAVPHRMTVTMPGREASVQVFLERATDGKADNKVRDQQFDLESLIAALKIERVNDLDAPSP